MTFEDADRARLKGRLSRGDLVRVARGLYGTPSRDPSPAVRTLDAHLAGIEAARRRLGSAFWFSHESAAVLWGCWTWHLDSSVHVTRLVNPSVVARQDLQLTQHWTAELPERDRASLDGYPVTTLERTVIDCARTLEVPRALVIADSALRFGADPARLGELLDTFAGRRGVRRARRLLALADPRPESPGETLVRWFALDGGLPPLELAFPVPTRLGRFWLDLAWPDLGVAIEFDGAVKYDGTFGDPVAALIDEKRRHDALAEVGWTLVRVTWPDLSQPHQVVRRLREARASARRRAPAPPR